jgi:FkbM family methyltransferase
MNLLNVFKNPEYFYKPALVIRKIQSAVMGNNAGKILTELLWKQKIYVNSQQHIAKSILAKGIFDLALTECIYRILKPGDNAIDVGANIGYTTNLMATICGKNGKVISFEPHPQLFNEYLLPNIALLQPCGFTGIIPHQLALSDETGDGVLFIPPAFDKNNGIATLVDNKQYKDKITIQKERLDKIVSPNQKVKLLKIDVEGYELEVLKGADNLLKNKAIENIIYEDYKALDRKIENYLSKYGYHVFEIIKGFDGIRLGDEDKNTKPNPEPNYLATLSPDAIQSIFRQKGWQCLK